MSRPCRILALLGSAATLAGPPCPAPAQTLPGDVETVCVTPLPGSTVGTSGAPEAIAVVPARDIDRTGIPDLSQALIEDIPGVAVNGKHKNSRLANMRNIRMERCQRRPSMNVFATARRFDTGRPAR